jgi:hypothetical protein
VVTIEGVEVIDVEETVDELLYAEQVEGGWRYEEYRRFVASKVSQDVG